LLPNLSTMSGVFPAGKTIYKVWTWVCLHHEKFKVATGALPTAQPARGEGRGMPAGKEGTAPVGARLQAGGGHLWEGDERWRLAMREQPQPGQDRRQESAISGRGKRDAGWRRVRSPSECMTAGRKWLCGAAGRGMPACEDGAAPARARPWTGMGHVGQREEGCRLAAREQPQQMHGRGQEVAISGRCKRDAGLRAESMMRMGDGDVD